MMYSVDILGDCFDGPTTSPTSPRRACWDRCGRLSRAGVDVIRTRLLSVMVSLRLLPLNKRAVAAAIVKATGFASYRISRCCPNESRRLSLPRSTLVRAEGWDGSASDQLKRVVSRASAAGPSLRYGLTDLLGSKGRLAQAPRLPKLGSHGIGRVQADSRQPMKLLCRRGRRV